ncbi:uncharacterized protein LOC109838093 isoform X2 [Asparagus officinalis]|uniref:uncharacterized protein LOC109838093 isoform X2 n=1 Tax=Asparagus officinalis TaxID=4686 RepID=UPI00098E4220|nr:uncharacterized protein LOC109838093 isoform X2 [Asparagus officinalis]
MAQLRSKRVMDAPSFDGHRAESSRQNRMEGIKLDAKRAESARQHVRALNTQFASWIQLQLQNHPDELWEDGAKDYLSHASNILGKFKDVVDWLKAEAAKSQTGATKGFPSDHSKSVAVLGNSLPIVKPEVNNGSAQEVRSSSLQIPKLPNSHGSGVFSVRQPSSSSSSLQNSGLPTLQNSSPFPFSQKPASSNFQSSSLSNTQNTGLFGISKISDCSSLQSAGSSTSQASGFFSFSQTPIHSSLQNSGSSGSPASGFFSFSQTPMSSSLQSSGLPSSQSSGLFGISQIPASSSSPSSMLSSSQMTGFSSNQKPANSSLQTSGLTSSQSSGFFSMNQTPVFGGTQSFTTPKVGTSEDVDEGDELEQPSSPSLKRTEEKGVIIVHEVKCKVYVKPDNSAAWKDIGVGQLSIKCQEGADKAAKESKPTIMIRNDAGRILLNALIYPGIKMNIKKNTIATIFHTSDGGPNDGVEAGKSNVVTRTYLLRLKTEDETTKLAAAIQDYAPSA